MITRREFVARTATFPIAGGTFFAALPLLGFISAARAREPSQGELMQPGPLGEMSIGADNAPVTIIEYASMTCSHCAHFHATTFPALKMRYIDTGKVRFIFREFPLDPLAAAGFMLARCGGKDKYLPLVETLFHQRDQWVVQKPIEPLLVIARQAGFTQQTFDQCLANDKLLKDIEKVRERATSVFGVNSTPTFFINGKKHTGALSIDDMAKLIDPYLKN
jgi:protein-disulfide isomerase